MRGCRVVVVGGSQAGLMTAIALRGIGCDVTVHERTGRPLEDRGAGIRLHPALTELLSARAGVDLAPLSCTIDRQQYLGADGRVLDVEPDSMAFSSWNALFRALRAVVPDDGYRLGSSCVGFEEHADAVVATFADGRREEADLLVFADGVGSIGRERLAPGAALRYSGYVVWRGCVPETEVAPAYRTLLADAHTTCLLRRSHANLYLVPRPGERPAEGRRLVNYVWYRNAAELNEIAIDRDGVLRPVSIPPGMVADEQVRALHASAAEVLPAPAAEVVRLTEEPFMQVIYDLEVETMATSRVCLVGDAGFVARPHLGAGTAKAAENAWALADALDVAGHDVPAALRAWEPGELELGRSLVRRSRQLGDRFQAAGDVVPGDAGLRATVAAPLRPSATDAPRLDRAGR